MIGEKHKLKGKTIMLSLYQHRQAVTLTIILNLTFFYRNSIFKKHLLTDPLQLHHEDHEEAALRNMAVEDNSTH